MSSVRELFNEGEMDAKEAAQYVYQQMDDAELSELIKLICLDGMEEIYNNMNALDSIEMQEIMVEQNDIDWVIETLGRNGDHIAAYNALNECSVSALSNLHDVLTDVLEGVAR